jgi:hypothetical protein
MKTTAATTFVILALLGGYQLLKTPSATPSAAPHTPTAETATTAGTAPQPPAPVARLLPGLSRPSETRAARPAPSQTPVAIDAPPAIASFQAWQARHAAEADPARRLVLESEGVALAAARRPAMKALIQSDPASALALSPSAAERATFPGPILDQLETLVAGRGDYLVAYFCTEEPDASGSHSHDGHSHELRRQVILDGNIYDAHIYGDRLNRQTETAASLYGVAIDNQLALHADDVVITPSATSPATPGAPAPLLATFEGETRPFADEAALTAWWEQTLAAEAAARELPLAALDGEIFDPATPPTGPLPPTEPYVQYTGPYSHQKGPKTLLFIYVRPSGGRDYTPKTEAQLGAELDSTSRWFYNVSYRQTWFGPKIVNSGRPDEMVIPRLAVTPVLAIPGDGAAYGNDNFGLLQQHALAAVRAQGGEWNGGRLDPSRFDRIIVYSANKLINSTGLAYLRGNFAWVGGGLQGGVAIHELNHNWGVNHSGWWKVPAGAHPRAAAPVGSSAGISLPVLEGMNGGDFGHSGYITARNLGFIEQSAGEVLTLAAGGTHRVYNLWDVHSKNPVSKLRALVMPVKYYGLYFAFYHVAGTDGGPSSRDWARNALYLSAYFPTNNPEAHLLDANPGSRAIGDNDDAGIKIGQTYSEGPDLDGKVNPLGGIHVTPVARGSTTHEGNTHEWIDVVVHTGNDVVGNLPPVASFSQTTYTVAPGAPLAVAVTASDPDGNPLAYDWSYGDGGYNITNLPAQTKTWSAPGLYLLRCTVSDMRGGTATARAWVNVGAVPTSPADTTPAQPGLAYRYYEGSWNTLPNFAALLPRKEGALDTVNLSVRETTDNFAIVYEGFITAPATDIYTFSVVADDGVHLRIGGRTVVLNNEVKANPEEKSGNLPLAAGRHPFRLEYFHKTGDETLRLSWETLSTPKTELTASAFAQTDWGSNLPPAVAFTSPAPGTRILVGSDLPLALAATDTDGIAAIALFAGSSLIGELAAPPFDFTWPRVSVGPKVLTAVATDTTGRTTRSAPLAIEVVSPPPTNVIGVNFHRENYDPNLRWSDRAGAIYPTAHWTNIPVGEKTDATAAHLADQDGLPTTARFSATAARTAFYSSNSSLADSGGRMLRAGFQSKDTAADWLTFEDIPYLQYDVYVYSDNNETTTMDAAVTEFRLGDRSRFLKNSLVANDGVGDFPDYDTWLGFKEATATSATAPNSELLGNYVVFRDQTRAAFSLSVAQTKRGVNGVQIVEVPATLPFVRLIPPVAGWTVTEGGASVAYGVRLSLPPTAPVTIAIDPGAQLRAEPATLVFTADNWNQVRTVTLSAADDTALEGDHPGILRHQVAATGAYAAVTVPGQPVTIADNDLPAIRLQTIGPVREGSVTPGGFVFTRAEATSLAAPVTVGFTLAGSATAPDATAADYSLAGASLVFDPSTRAGTVVIPAGQASATLQITALDDATPETYETIVATVTPAPGAYRVVTPASATINLIEHPRLDYFTEIFNSNRLWDLNNKSLTYTPSGTGYTASLEPATAFPSGATAFTTFNDSAMSGGTSSGGWWSHNLAAPFTFFDVPYAQIFVSTEGAISFKSGGALTDLFYAGGFGGGVFLPGRPVLAAFAANLTPYSGGSGTIQHARVGSPGSGKTVIFYNQVRVSGSNPVTNAGVQVELFDTGVIRITWLNAPSLRVPVTVGLSSGVEATMPSSPYNTTATPRPFFSTDLGALEPSAPRPPAFATLPPTATTAPYRYDIVATDPDDAPGPLVITAVTKPDWLALTDLGSGRATLSGNPPAAGGVFNISLQATDGSASASQFFTLAVPPAAGNAPPVLSGSPASAATVGTAYSATFTATDPEGRPLVFSTFAKPTWLTLADSGAGSATLSGTPPEGATSPAEVTLAVNDGEATTTTTFAIEVSRPPTVEIISPRLSRVVLASRANDLELEAAVHAHHSAPPTLLWTHLSGPGSVAFGAPAAATTRATFDQPGHHLLRLTATTDAGATTADVHVFVETPSSDVLADGLQLRYAFNEGEGDTIADLSGNNRPATLLNTPYNASGYEGAAYSSEGGVNTTAQVDYPSPSRLTLSTWLYADRIPDGTRTLFAFANGTTGRLRMALETDTRRLVFFSGHSTSGRWRLEADLPALRWTHLAIAYDATSLANHPAAYLDGQPVPVTRLTPPSGSLASVTTLRIGATASLTAGSANWRGRIDEFRVYDRVVPPADIPLLMTPGAVNQAPLIAPGSGQSTTPSAPVVTLAATVTDDDLPAPVAPPAVLWTVESGPAAGELVAPAAIAGEFIVAPVTGAYTLRLAADDGSARASATTRVTVVLDTVAGGGGDSFAAWIADPARDIPPEQRAPLADPDADGLPNLLEYALDRDPLVPDPSPPLLTSTSNLNLSVSFYRARADLIYTVEASSTLAPDSWQAIATDPGTLGTEVTVTDPEPASPRRFLRLRVTPR